MNKKFDIKLVDSNGKELASINTDGTREDLTKILEETLEEMHNDMKQAVSEAIEGNNDK